MSAVHGLWVAHPLREQHPGDNPGMREHLHNYQYPFPECYWSSMEAQGAGSRPIALEVCSRGEANSPARSGSEPA